MELPSLPDNVGKTRRLHDIYGKVYHIKILDEIKFIQSNLPDKAIFLQKIHFLEEDRIEFRLGYYIIGKKPRNAGKWVWGQFATMLPAEDFNNVVKQAHERGWIEW
jgi:hypothetical protein